MRVRIRGVSYDENQDGVEVDFIKDDKSNDFVFTDEEFENLYTALREYYGDTWWPREQNTVLLP